MNNKEILDSFGQKIVDQIIDRYYRQIPFEIKEGLKIPARNELNSLFDKLNEQEKNLIVKFVLDLINSTLFDYLEFFELNPEFRLVFEDGAEGVNLLDVSEMLKAEPLGDDGWIERFSKYKALL